LNELPQIKFKNDLILTTEQLAEFYGTTPRRISENFNYHADKFIAGTHYYLLKGQELRDFKEHYGNSGLVLKQISHLYLWTRRGASRHSKMLGTDRAWEMFDQLEETYFRATMQLPMTPEEKIRALLENVDAANQKIKKIDRRVDQLEQNQTLSPGEYNWLSKRIGTAIKEYVDAHRLSLNKPQRSKLYQDISRGLNEVTNVKTRSQLRKRDFDIACEFIANWMPSTATLTIIKQLNGGGDQ